MIRSTVFFLATFALAFACDGSGDGDDASATDGDETSGGAEADVEVDADAELARAAAYATELTRINATDFVSEHGLAATVNVFASSEGLAALQALDPANPSDPGFTEGTMVLKEHLNASGAPDGYLVMVKGPAGYAPEAGDWWWARVDAAGTAQNVGQVDFCIGCHAGASASDYVFGVPLDNRR